MTMQMMYRTASKLFPRSSLSVVPCSHMLIVSVCAVLAAAPGAVAQDCVFSTADDSGSGSLRECLGTASDGATVTYSQTSMPAPGIRLASSLDIDKTVTIAGENPISVLAAVGPAFTLSGAGNVLTLGRNVSIETAMGSTTAIEILSSGNTVNIEGDVNGNGFFSIGVSASGGGNYIDVSGAVQVTGFIASAIAASDGDNVVVLSGEASTSFGSAIAFLDAGNNTLELHPGYSINGNASAFANGNDKLALGGTGAGVFDLDRIGSTMPLSFNQFLDFDRFAVESGVWTLSGSTDETFLVTGGTLAGVGTFGGLSILPSGVHAPGNSIGVQTITGNYTNYGVLEVELAENGLSNQIIVNGDVDVTGATLRLVALPGVQNWLDTETYLIIDNAGVNAVTGTFALDNTLAFFDGSLNHAGGSGNDVVLTMVRNDRSFADLGSTPNQKGAAAALQGFDSQGAVYQELLGLSVSDVQAAYDSASGEIHASSQNVLDQTFSLFQSSLGGSLVSSAGGSNTSAASGYMAQPQNSGLYAIDAAASQTSGAVMWARPLAGRGTVFSDGNGAQLDWSAGGMSAGYEAATSFGQGETWLGIGAGYLHSVGASGSATAAGDSALVGAYGGWSEGAYAFSGSVAYGAQHVSTSRDITIGALRETAEANYWSHSAGLDLEASYGFALSDAFTISPVGTLRAAWNGHGGAQETGAGALNASIAPSSSLQLDSGIGIELAHSTVLADGGELELSGRALWQHRFGDTTPSRNIALAGSPTSFAVSGAAGDRDRGLVGAGVSYKNGNFAARADYNGGFSAHEISHAVSAGFNFKF